MSTQCSFDPNKIGLLSAIRPLKPVMQAAIRGGYKVQAGLLASAVALRATVQLAFPILDKAKNLVEDLDDVQNSIIENIGDRIAAGGVVTQLKEKYGPYVDNVEEMGEKLLQGTLNICDINLPNMQILGNGKALRRALPAKIPWSFPLLVTPLAIKELDNRFTGVTSISNINLNEFESSVGNIKNKLNKDIESPFNKVNEVIKSKKRTINPPDLGIISQLKEDTLFNGYTNIFDYAEQNYNDLSDTQREELDKHMISETTKKGTMAVKKILSAQKQYVEKQLRIDPTQDPLTLLEFIQNEQRNAVSRYKIKGVPYVGTGSKYLTVYVFSYSDILNGKTTSNPITSFENLDMEIREKVIELSRDFKVQAEFNKNTAPSANVSDSKEAPPGYTYNDSGELIPLEVSVFKPTVVQTTETTTSNRDDPNNYQPHTMYNPQTGRGFLAQTYDQHIAYSNLGYIHDNPGSSLDTVPRISLDGLFTQASRPTYDVDENKFFLTTTIDGRIATIELATVDTQPTTLITTDTTTATAAAVTTSTSISSGGSSVSAGGGGGGSYSGGGGGGY